MTAHDHSTDVPGCYRCDLSRDELIDALREEQTDTREAITELRRHLETCATTGRRRGQTDRMNDALDGLSILNRFGA